MSEKKPGVNLSHYLLGLRLDNWIHLLIMDGFRLDGERIPQTLLISLISLVLFPFALLEGAVCALPMARTKIEKDPVFILGHWRSGTTYLQNLLSRDPQFGWADPLSTAMFSNYVLLGWALRKGVGAGIKGARPMDNVKYALDLPMEETFCVGGISPYTLNHLLAFPNMWERFIPAAFVDRLTPRKRAAFKRTYAYVVKKLTLTNGSRQLVLKSPDNSARVGTLLELYPDARFVNIYRDPYETVGSAVDMIVMQVELNRLTKVPVDDLRELVEDMVIGEMFEPMYRRLFAMEGKFRENRYVSVRYENFVQEPERWLRYIYETLEMDGFEEALPRFRAFADTQKDYRKNRRTLSPSLRKKINDRLGFYFEHYGCEMITSEEGKNDGSA